MKNLYRIAFLILFLGIGFYMIYECYGTTLGWGTCINLLELMHPTKGNSYMDPFFALCIFTPAIILILSFLWKFPVNKFQRVFLFGLMISAGWMGFFNLLIGAFSSSFNLKIHYLVILIWDFASFMWIFSLSIAPNWRAANWPFDKKGK